MVSGATTPRRAHLSNENLLADHQEPRARINFGLLADLTPVERDRQPFLIDTNAVVASDRVAGDSNFVVTEATD